MTTERNLFFRIAYRTFRFNTVNGDLARNEYAFFPNTRNLKVIVRQHPENNANTRTVDISTIDLVAMTEVQIVGDAHYIEYVLPDGRMFREKMTSFEYIALGIKDSSPKQRKLTDAQITDAIKDDALWQ